MDWKTKMRSQLGAFTDSYFSTLPHPCMAEELAEWSTKKEIVSKTAILETIELWKKSTNNSHYTENYIELFVGSLQYNIVFDMRFKVLDGSMKDKKYFNCPCNTFMAP